MNLSEEARTIEAVEVPVSQRGSRFPYYLVLGYLLLEFGRPQEIIPGLTYLHLPGIVTGLLAVTLLLSGKLRLTDIQTKLFIGLLVFMAFHVPFDLNNYWAFQTTREMAQIFVAYLGIITFIDSFEKYKTMINLWLATHIFLAIYGIIKGGEGIGGFLADANDFALVLNMIIPFSFFMAMEAKTQSKKFLLLGMTGVFVICVITTFSRGGFVGLVAVGFYCWLRSPGKIGSMFGVAILLFTMLYFAPQKYWDRIETIQSEAQGTQVEGTGGERIYSWKAAWRMFLDHPVFGVGPQNFPWNFEAYEAGEGYAGRLHGSRAAHSLYFTLLSELGAVGTIIFFLMIGADWRGRKEILELSKKQNESEDLKKVHFLALALGGSLVGYFVSGTFITVLYYPSFWIVMAFGIALRRTVHLDFMKHQI